MSDFMILKTILEQKPGYRERGHQELSAQLRSRRREKLTQLCNEKDQPDSLFTSQTVPIMEDMHRVRRASGSSISVTEKLPANRDGSQSASSLAQGAAKLQKPPTDEFKNYLSSRSGPPKRKRSGSTPTTEAVVGGSDRPEHATKRLKEGRNVSIRTGGEMQSLTVPHRLSAKKAPQTLERPPVDDSASDTILFGTKKRKRGQSPFVRLRKTYDGTLPKISTYPQPRSKTLIYDPWLSRCSEDTKQSQEGRYSLRPNILPYHSVRLGSSDILWLFSKPQREPSQRKISLWSPLHHDESFKEFDMNKYDLCMEAVRGLKTLYFATNAWPDELEVCSPSEAWEKARGGGYICILGPSAATTHEDVYDPIRATVTSKSQLKTLKPCLIARVATSPTICPRDADKPGGKSEDSFLWLLEQPAGELALGKAALWSPLAS